jgi:hypothetical protein
VLSGDTRDLWIYLLGPVSGGLLAVALAWALRGAPSSEADIAAQGRIAGIPDGPGSPDQPANGAEQPQASRDRPPTDARP